MRLMLEKYGVCCDLFNGFDWSAWKTRALQGRLSLLPTALEHGRNRFLSAALELSKAFALMVPHEEVIRIRDDVTFFQAVLADLIKRAPGEARLEEDLDHAIRQIVSRAVVPEGVVDLFAAAGLKKPDISILSKEFLAKVLDLFQRAELVSSPQPGVMFR